jgi:hypothetical protein
MFSKIWNYLVNVEQTIEHDVEAIISTFTDTVTKLEAAAEAKAKQADEAWLQSRILGQTADALKAEGARAQEVAAKIKDLVS